MKKIIFSILSVAMFGTIFMACGGDKKTNSDATETIAKKGAADVKMELGATYTADLANSQVLWTGSKVAGKHMGTVSLKEGSLTVNKSTLTGGSFVLDMNTITVTDLEAGKGKEKLEGHLKGGEGESADHFFNVANHPTAKFEIKSVQTMAADAAGNNHKISGDLTIKGQTHPISFLATVVVAGEMVSATAQKVIFDRTKFNINYGSKKAFKDLVADKVISDDIELNISLMAKK